MSVEITVALIGVAGLVAGATIQWFVSRSTFRAETARIYQQLKIEFNQQQFSTWQNQFTNNIAELLSITDPEIVETYDKTKIVPLVLKCQLMLNPRIKSHAEVNNLINQLALTVNGWNGKSDSADILALHARLLEASKSTIYIPQIMG